MCKICVCVSGVIYAMIYSIWCILLDLFMTSIENYFSIPDINVKSSP